MAKNTVIVKEGYKETKVGIIPKDWEVEKLNDIINYTKGFAFKSSNYVDKGKRIIRISDTDYNSIKNDNPVYIKEEEIQLYSKWELKTNDLIISTVGSRPPMYNSMVGKTIRVDRKNEGNLLNQNTVLIRSNNVCNQIFLYYHLKLSRYIYFITTICRGNANQANITLKDLFSYLIPFPPLPEQQKIAKILTTWDAAIAKTSALLTQLKERKKGLMQVLLTGKKRVKGFEGEWKEVRLGELLVSKPKYGINAPSVEYSSELPTYLRITDIDESGRFIRSKKTSVNHSGFKEFILEKDELVFARTGNTTGKTYLYNPKDGELVYAGFLIKVSPNSKKLNSRFLKFFTETFRYWIWVKKVSPRSGQPGINGKQYASMPIIIPPLQEQTAIAKILTTADTEIAHYEKYLRSLEKQKKGLMQRLLTGAVRVKVS